MLSAYSVIMFLMVNMERRDVVLRHLAPRYCGSQSFVSLDESLKTSLGLLAGVLRTGAHNSREPRDQLGLQSRHLGKQESKSESDVNHVGFIEDTGHSHPVRLTP